MTTPDLEIPLPYTVQYFSSSQDNGWLHIPEGQQTTAVAAAYRQT